MKNKTTVQIDSPGRRAAAYWFADGLPEILFGLFFLLPCAIILAGKEMIHTQIQNLWIRWVVIMFAGWLPFILWLLYQAILNFLKARISYPRTGYAQPPRFPDNSKILSLRSAHPTDDNVSSFAVATIPLMCSGVLFMGFLHSTSWGLPLVMSGIAAGVYFLNRDDVRPYSWPAVLPIALAGFLAAALELEPMVQTWVPMLICGVWLLAVGIWTLAGYLRANPKPDSGREGRP